MRRHMINKQKFSVQLLIIFLPIILAIYLGAQKNPLIDDWDGSFDFPQHMF